MNAIEWMGRVLVDACLKVVSFLVRPSVRALLR